MRMIVALGALAMLAACQNGEAPPAENVAAATVEAANVAAVVPADAPPPAFAQCGVCHSVKPDGKHGVGPNLRGVFGTRAGEIAGYKFSPAMKASGLTWDDATLDRYLTNPRTVVPGTKMSLVGLSDATKRARVIGYLKSLK